MLLDDTALTRSIYKLNIHKISSKYLKSPNIAWGMSFTGRINYSCQLKQKRSQLLRYPEGHLQEVIH